MFKKADHSEIPKGRVVYSKAVRPSQALSQSVYYIFPVKKGLFPKYKYI